MALLLVNFERFYNTEVWSYKSNNSFKFLLKEKKWSIIVNGFWFYGINSSIPYHPHPHPKKRKGRKQQTKNKSNEKKTEKSWKKGKQRKGKQRRYTA